MIGEEDLEVGACLLNLDGGAASTTETPSQTSSIHPQQEQGTAKTYTDNQCWQCGEVGHLERSCPMLNGKGLFQGGNA